MRLIDADELLKNEFKNDISSNAFQNLVKRQQTIDAVPVVRCKDCKWWKEPYCVKNYVFVRRADWFCGDGERRTE